MNKSLNDPNGYPRIMFASGVGTVTGANFLLEATADERILVDCGLVQGEKTAEAVNREPFGYDPTSVQALVITHAHLDHVGRIPKLVREGFAGTIYSTPETRDLAELVLNDAVGILAEEAKREGNEPLYGAEDVQRIFPLWKTVPYHESTKITDSVSIFLKDAGHILGSSMVEVTVSGITTPSSPARATDVKILFTGDLGNSPHPLLRDTEPVGDVDCMIMESTYGDRNHDDREDRDATFERIIKEALGRGGTLVIPAFSLDRTQVLLYELNNLVEKKRIPSVPIFVDSPMAIKATDIYRRSVDLFNDQVQAQIKGGDDIFSFPHLEYTTSPNESRSIDYAKGAKIILAGSGMSVGGRVISHEEHYLPDARSTILLVGYQGVSSLGRALANGTKKAHIHGHDVPVNAHIETLYGYSAHKDGDHLVQFVSTATDRLKQVYVCMGEPGASMHLAQRLNDELNVKALMPKVRALTRV